MASSKLCRWRRAFVFLLVLVSLEGFLFVYSSGEQDDNYNTYRQLSGSSSSSSSLRHNHNRRKATSTTSSTTTAARTPRIVGGTDTSNVPYFILWGGCGATLIHNDIALSAAHCSERDNAHVGPKNRSDTSNWTRVDKVRKHPQYNSESYDYDFAVLKLNGWFQQDTVKLNVDEESPQPGESLQILGFGGQSQTLKQGRVDCISPSICAEQWLRAGYFIDEEAAICAKAEDGVDACTGDSGGPLLLDGSSVQVGVISSGSGCDGRLPTVYSRVSAGQDWITQQICELSDFPPKFCRKFNSGPGRDETRIRVDINLDEFPEDIRWMITESYSGETVATSGGNFEVPNSLESKFVDLPDDKNYIFTIEDVGGFGDGLGNDGRYKVVTVNNDGNDDNTLVSGGGNLQDSESTTFSIGNTPNPTFDPTPLPTPNPVNEAAAAGFPSLNRPIITQNNNDPNQINQSALYSTPNWMVPIMNRPASLPTMNPTQSLVISTTTNTRNPSKNPTKLPSTKRPTKRPTKTNSPMLSTSQPSKKPTKLPSTKRPTKRPTKTNSPSVSSRPSVSAIPSYFPTNDPSIKKETDEPTLNLSSKPTNNKKTPLPTPVPTSLPTKSPTKVESSGPSRKPTITPTDTPTTSPTNDPARRPTSSPTKEPTESPTKATTDSPTKKPTEFPTKAATDSPTEGPTIEPTPEPTPEPIEVQILVNAELEGLVYDDDDDGRLLHKIDEDTVTNVPTTVEPSPALSENFVTPQPTTFIATEIQTPVPTTPQPTRSTSAPTISPTTSRPNTQRPSTSGPTISPTTVEPTVSQTTERPSPESSPSENFATPQPTIFSTTEIQTPVPTTPQPTRSTSAPTISSTTPRPSTSAPTISPTTVEPTVSQTTISVQPSSDPSSAPSENPSISMMPSSEPSSTPSESPSISMVPSSSPSISMVPSSSPSKSPSSSPSASSSASPSASPSENPSSAPSTSPSPKPSATPSISSMPSGTPSVSAEPSMVASSTPSETPERPSPEPSSMNSLQPTSGPTTIVNEETSTPLETLTPTVIPTSSNTAEPSDEPKISYMAFVSVNILNDPEQVSWRIIDAVTKEQLFGYSAGMYDQNTTYSNIFNIQTGEWQLQLFRESLAADVTAEIGILNMVTAMIDPVGKLSLVPGTSATTATTTIQLD